MWAFGCLQEIKFKYFCLVVFFQFLLILFFFFPNYRVFTYNSSCRVHFVLYSTILLKKYFFERSTLYIQKVTYRKQLDCLVWHSCMDAQLFDKPIQCHCGFLSAVSHVVSQCLVLQGGKSFTGSFTRAVLSRSFSITCTSWKDNINKSKISLMQQARRWTPCRWHSNKSLFMQL